MSHENHTLDDLSAQEEALDALIRLPSQLNPHLSLNPGALAFAYHYYADLCCSDARSRHQAQKAFAALSRQWTITDQGELRLPGSNNVIYLVSPHLCCLEGQYATNKKTGKHSPQHCKGWLYSGGGCYHRAAYEILRIAQYADQLI